MRRGATERVAIVGIVGGTVFVVASALANVPVGLVFAAIVSMMATSVAFPNADDDGPP